MSPANYFTLSRLISAPLFAFFFVKASDSHTPELFLWFSVLAACCIEISDFLDGRIARRRGEVSMFGKIVDPMADSISRQTIFLSFTITDIIPLWMFLIFLNRDAILSVIRIMCAHSGTIVAAKFSGKIKAVLQAIGAFCVLAVCLAHAYNIPWVPETLWGKHPGFWIMIIPTFFTVLSMFDYLIPNWPVIKKAMTPDISNTR